MSDETKRVVREQMLDGFNRHDLDTIMSFSFWKIVES